MTKVWICDHNYHKIRWTSDLSFSENYQRFEKIYQTVENSVNLCLEFLEELSTLWEDISNTRKFGELVPWVSRRIINALRRYIKHSKIRWTCTLSFSKNYQRFEKIYQTLERVFHQISEHFDVGKKTRLRLLFSTHFSVFGYLMKHSSSRLKY